MGSRSAIDKLYNPAEISPQELIERFVVRLKLFERIYREISTASMQVPEQHYLIQGRRGMGKTTLLLRLAYEIEKDPKLNTWLMPVVYNEEEHSINRLSRFWERAAEILADKYTDFAGLPDDMDAQHRVHGGRENEFEEAVFNLLIDRLQKNGRKLVLFVDNFGTLFRSFNERENRRLRTVLQTCPDIRIIGATPVVLGEIYDVKHPFYEFFKVERLSGLSKDEARDLLLKIGETTGKLEAIQNILKNQPGRVETLRRFTNGVIRTMVLLFDVFTDDLEGEAFHDLEIIIDRTTPLYQHRMEDLSPQQKPIVEAIALAWDAVSTKEIVARTRLESKVVSAQLSQLCDNEIIERKLTHNKNHLYQLSERFFNIWYLMRFGRRDARHKVKWLIRFLESWCDPKALAERTNSHIAAMKAGTYHPSGALLLSEALAGSKYLTRETQHTLMEETAEYLKKRDPKLAKELSKSDLDLWKEARQLVETGEADKAIALVNKMVTPDYYALGEALYDQKEFEKAANVFLKDGSGEVLNKIGSIYASELQNYVEAEKYYLKAYKKGDLASILNLARLYDNQLNEFSKAEEFYLLLIEEGLDFAAQYLGNLYANKLNDYGKAEKYYRLAVEKGYYYEANSLIFFNMILVKNREQALVYADRLVKQEPKEVALVQMAASIFLRAGEVLRAMDLGSYFLYDEKTIERDSFEYTNYLILLLAYNQYNFLYEYFTSERGLELQVKDRFKPIWYALMYYMQDKHPSEYLRMGGELKETVEEIKKTVEEIVKKVGAMKENAALEVQEGQQGVLNT